MDIVTQVILPLILAFIMFSMGLSLVIDDFKRVAKFPKAFMIGAILQIVSLPVLAFLLTKFWVSTGNVDPAYAVGMIIIAACPGGVTSNLMTHLAKGDTALSISLTAIISILSVFTIPFIVNFGYVTFMGADQGSPLPVAKTIFGIFCVTTVPVAIGMLIKAKKSDFADKLEPIARKVATLFFVIIIIAAVAKKWSLVVAHGANLLPVTLALNVITMFIAWAISKLLKLETPQGIAITFECGLQNGTLAIMIALTFLNNEAMMLPGGVYSLLMFFTSGIFLLGHFKKKQMANSTIE
ncbi:MAG: bile acid:sodium symporter family protein [Halobacteriovoraceae bacterium]|nr:bile acid:sodium symporter family protein [Halobacteriovoraceae bacterium]